MDNLIERLAKALLSEFSQNELDTLYDLIDMEQVIAALELTIEEPIKENQSNPTTDSKETTMSRQPNRDITKLPEWAQRQIEALQSTVDYYKTQIDLIGSGDSPITFSQGMDREKGLPSDASVTFLTTAGRIRVCFRDGKVEITGDSTILVKPNAGNRITVFCED